MAMAAGSPPSAEVLEATRATIADYSAVAEGYAAGNMEHDVSQNIAAMLRPLASAEDTERAEQKQLDILDVCCASGRDLLALTWAQGAMNPEAGDMICRIVFCFVLLLSAFETGIELAVPLKRDQ